MTFPFKIEVTTTSTNEKEIKTLNKSDFPKGYRNDFKIIEYLNIAFRSPNFQWKFL